MQVFTNIELNDEAYARLLEIYKAEDASDPSSLTHLPQLAYISACTIPDVKLGYHLFMAATGASEGRTFFAFDNGRKFFTIQFFEPFDPEEHYLLESIDGAFALIKENDTCPLLTQLISGTP